MSLDDRILDTVKALILDEMPGLTYMGLWEYSVTRVNGDGTIEGAPTDARIPLPPLGSVPIAALAAGGVSEPVPGALFLVEFHDIDGSRYGMISCSSVVKTATLDAVDGVSLAPSASSPLRLGPAEKAVARVGDQIQVFWPLGLLNGVFTPTGGSPVTLTDVPIQLLTPAPALITYGNDGVLS